ncbi:MAG: AI-2E family transporter [Cyclobacteriaceae bacterium]
MIPISFALLLSFILFPLHKKLISWGWGNILAALSSILALIIIIAGVLTFFSAEILSLSDQLTDFGDKLTKLFSDVLVFANENLPFLGNLDKDELMEDGKTWLKDSAGGLLGSTFSNTTSFFTGLFTAFIYTFLFLIYRKGLVKAFLHFPAKEEEGTFYQMLRKIQLVGQKYLSGMITLILILGFANSIGLWIIGIDSPFLFGFLAATLSIIPYIGTTLGATIPVLYALMSKDELWVPIAVAIMFWIIQVIESNFLSPKIVGKSVNVNAFAAILSLIIGASVWGVAGMILFLPFSAMFKVICEHYDQLKPLSLLIGESTYKEGEEKDSKSLWKSLKEKVS